MATHGCSHVMDTLACHLHPAWFLNLHLKAAICKPDVCRVVTHVCMCLAISRSRVRKHSESTRRLADCAIQRLRRSMSARRSITTMVTFGGGPLLSRSMRTAPTISRYGDAWLVTRHGHPHLYTLARPAWVPNLHPEAAICKPCQRHVIT